jgi:hypothetical protein
MQHTLNVDLEYYRSSRHLSPLLVGYCSGLGYLPRGVVVLNGGKCLMESALDGLLIGQELCSGPRLGECFIFGQGLNQKMAERQGFRKPLVG